MANKITHRARCTCGWYGPSRLESGTAQADLDVHLNSVVVHVGIVVHGRINET